MSLIGRIVVSRAGRDKGEHFAVIGECEGYLVLANGRTRPIERPKRKKMKHVEVLTGQLSESFILLLQSGGATNKRLFREIKENIFRLGE